MQKILLIKPKYRSYEIYLPPVNLALLAGSLRVAFPEAIVEIKDFNLPGVAARGLEDALRRLRPDLVGITGLTCDLTGMLAAARRVKQTDSKIVTVVGGHHATVAPESLINESAVDYIIRGEGEYALVDLINALSRNGDLDKVSGLVRRTRDGSKTNEIRPIKDLDALPPAAWDLISLKEYSQVIAHRYHPQGYIISSRGCPYHCAFCTGHQVVGRRWRGRSPDNVIAEIEQLIALHDVKGLFFWDENVAIDRGRVSALCAKMQDMTPIINWGCMLRVDQVDAELLKRMKEAGCYQIYFGLESGSDRVLKDMEKGITCAQSERAVRLTHEAGIEVGACFIIGYPTETVSDILKTIRLARRLPCRKASFYLMQAYPGTALYETLERQRLLLPRRDLGDKVGISAVTEGVSSPVIIRLLHLWANLSFFARPDRIFFLLKENLLSRTRRKNLLRVAYKRLKGAS